MAERFGRDDERRWSPKGGPGRRDDIDYRAEGDDPGSEKRSDTDKGYDDAAHSGDSRFGELSGSGGVFGTSGGGNFNSGFQVIEPPGIADRNIDDRDIDSATSGRRERIDKSEAERVSHFDASLDKEK